MADLLEETDPIIVVDRAELLSEYNIGVASVWTCLQVARRFTLGFQ